MYLMVDNGEGNGSPLQYSRLENPMDRGGWRAAVRGIAESDATEHTPRRVTLAFWAVWVSVDGACTSLVVNPRDLTVR